MQPHLHIETKTATLRKYREYDFDIQEDDHILTLEHKPCGKKFRFSATGAAIESIQETCEEHIGECPEYKEDKGELVG